jgi:CheY-like chemotaxis protein
MANILNNDPGEVFFPDKNQDVHFTAPQAKILIVDDIVTNLRVAEELMVPYGMSIKTCMSGPEAIGHLKNNRYDLVFMDHMMPDMDGIEATGLIRSMEDNNCQKIPIIALSANAVIGQKEIFLESGMDDFLAKPIDMEKLNEILEKWLPPEKKMNTVYVQRRDEEKIEFPNILGLDVSLGLLNCGGKIPAYLSILEDFCKDAEARLVKIAEALSARETKVYITLVHALKGAALSIGAAKTGEKALYLEKAAESVDLAALEGKTAELQENVQTLIENIRLTAERQKVDDKQERVGIPDQQLEILKTALVEMDIEAINRMFKIFSEMPLDDQTRTFVAELEQLVLMFEYETAIETIEEQF